MIHYSNILLPVKHNLVSCRYMRHEQYSLPYPEACRHTVLQKRLKRKFCLYYFFFHCNVIFKIIITGIIIRKAMVISTIYIYIFISNGYVYTSQMNVPISSRMKFIENKLYIALKHFLQLTKGNTFPANFNSECSCGNNIVW